MFEDLENRAFLETDVRGEPLAECSRARNGIIRVARVGERRGVGPDGRVVVADSGDAGRPLRVVGGQCRKEQLLLDGEVAAALSVEEAMKVLDRLDDRLGIGAP